MKLTINKWVRNAIVVPNPTQYTIFDEYRVNRKVEIGLKFVRNSASSYFVDIFAFRTLPKYAAETLGFAILRALRPLATRAPPDLESLLTALRLLRRYKVQFQTTSMVFCKFGTNSVFGGSHFIFIKFGILGWIRNAYEITNAFVN